VEQVGIIKKTFGNQAEVVVRRTSGCGGNCESCGGCSAETAYLTVVLKNDVGAKAGDLVEIEAKPQKILKYTFIVYMIPFFMLLMGIFLGVSFFKSVGNSNYEILGFGVGMLFLAISFGIIKLIDKYVNKREENPLEIKRIIK